VRKEFTLEAIHVARAAFDMNLDAAGRVSHVPNEREPLGKAGDGRTHSDPLYAAG
jgi:hypothetical protein